MARLVQDLEIIDALPYIDRQYESRKGEVDMLVQQEMAQMPQKDYLEPLGAAHEPFTENPRLRAEFERVAAGKPLDAIDASRYLVPAPPVNRQKKPDAWKAAIANAQAQLEHQEARLMNLELLNKYGSNKWVRHLEHVDAVRQRTKLALAAYEKEAKGVNQARKELHTSTGTALHQLSMQWYQLVAKNRLIEADCVALERKLAMKPKAMEEQAGERDVVEGGDGDVEMEDMSESSAPASAPAVVSSAPDPAAAPAPAPAPVATPVATPAATAVPTPTAAPSAPVSEDMDVDMGEGETAEDKESRVADIKKRVGKLLVKDLKKELSELSLSTSGRKADLAARLIEHLTSQL